MRRLRQAIRRRDDRAAASGLASEGGLRLSGPLFQEEETDRRYASDLAGLNCLRYGFRFTAL